MIDLISYLVCDVDLKINTFIFDDTILDGKRYGYKEFYGDIYGSSVNNKFQFEIHCDASDDDLNIIIDTLNHRYVICEKNGTLIDTIKDANRTVISKKFYIDYISNTTQKVINGIIRDGECQLTNYDKSKELHLMFINCIMSYYGSKLGDKNVCPIT